MFVFQGDSEASETSNVLELMKMYREELRQVSGQRNEGEAKSAYFCQISATI